MRYSGATIARSSATRIRKTTSQRQTMITRKVVVVVAANGAVHRRRADHRDRRIGQRRVRLRASCRVEDRLDLVHGLAVLNGSNFVSTR